jgi:hypothetical protein
LWEASDRLCGKRLKSLVPTLLPVLVRQGHLRTDTLLQTKLLTISAATIDRLLHDARAAKSGSRREVPPTIQRRSVLKRASRECTHSQPGHLAAHLIPHRGELATGPAAATLRLTDLYSRWTDRAPLPVGSPCDVMARLGTVVDGLPFRCSGLVLGGELAFCKDAVSSFCSGRRIELVVTPPDGNPTPPDGGAHRRSEDRSDPVIPPMLGARKLEGEAALTALASLYAAAGPYVNFFHPCSFGSDETAHSRLLASGALSEQEESRLRHMADGLDPIGLLAEIRALQTHLKILSAGFLPHRAEPHDEADRPRHWRTHRNAFEADWPEVQAWEAADPHQTSLELFERLRREHPGVYREGQLRSFQRRLKQWRSRPS